MKAIKMLCRPHRAADPIPGRVWAAPIYMIWWETVEGECGYVLVEGHDNGIMSAPLVFRRRPTHEDIAQVVASTVFPIGALLSVVAFEPQARYLAAEVEADVDAVPPSATRWS